MSLVDVSAYLQALKPVEETTANKKRIISLVDLTSLNDTDTEASIATFCTKANTSLGPVAAVCVYPQFVRIVAAQLAGSSVKVATVVNFPEGQDPLNKVLADINGALTDGAQEIDVVFPYTQYLQGKRKLAQQFIGTCKTACGDNVVLKVILETGILQDPHIIAQASHDVLEAGANFVKTSTGKVPQGATLEVAATILKVIRDLRPSLKQRIGIKISGGVREFQQAAQYLQLADQIMGPTWATAETFRIGASKLVDDICQ